MPPLLVLFASILGIAQFFLPTRWAFIPLWVAACHTPYTSFLGGVTVCRVILICGLLRAYFVREDSSKNFLGLDRCVAIFAIVAVASTLGHEWNLENPLNTRLRMVLDVCGTYVYMRLLSHPPNSLIRWSTAMVGVLVPFAVLLLFEKSTGNNVYCLLGSEHFISQIRDGSIRAQGPFGTPILSGTVGAVTFPLMIPLFHTKKIWCFVGIAACLAIVYASGSSGPISSLLISLIGFFCWRWRDSLSTLGWATGLTLLFLHFIKERPIWYLMALMDFVGGSTGWHRAFLIDMAIQHLDEWWFCGTDRTSHWLPYALAAIPNHCDLTNYYIYLGVTAGILLIAVLLIILLKSFYYMFIRLNLVTNSYHHSLLIWCLIVTLYTHAVTFLSISYFDQIYVFFWGLLGALSAFSEIPATNPELDPCENYFF